MVSYIHSCYPFAFLCTRVHNRLSKQKRYTETRSDHIVWCHIPQMAHAQETSIIITCCISELIDV